MSLYSDLLPVVGTLRTIASDWGLRTHTVAIRVVTYNGPYNGHGVTGTNADTTLSPAPKCRKLDAEDAAWFGGGPPDSATGRQSSYVWEIGPITPSYTGGGYTAADLAPAGSKTQRTLVILDGDPYEIVKLDDSHPFRVMLTVRRTAPS